MNKIKTLILLMTMLTTSAWVMAQGLQINGTLEPLSIPICEYNEEALRIPPDLCEAYLNDHGITITSSCSISEGLQFFCDIIYSSSSQQPEGCNFTACRYFLIYDDCFSEEIRQTILVTSGITLSGRIESVSAPPSCTFDLESFMLEDPLGYLTDTQNLHYLTIESECSDNVYVSCFVYLLEETECAFVVQRQFLIYDDYCDVNSAISIEQTVTMNKGVANHEYTLDPLVLYSDALDEPFPGQYDSERILNYLVNMWEFQTPSCWNYVQAYYDDPVEVFDSDICNKTFEITFHLVHKHDNNPVVACSEGIIIHQTVTLSPNEIEVDGIGLDEITYSGCITAEEFPAIETIQGFTPYGVTFSNYLYPEDFVISHHDERQETEDCTQSKVLRTYSIDYNCSEPQLHTEYSQFITVNRNLSVNGVLEPLYPEDGEEPETYTTLNELKNKGMHLQYLCDENDIVISEPHDTPNYLGIEGLTMREYVLSSSSCDLLSGSISQMIQTVNKDPQYFHLDGYTDVSDDGAKDGTATLSQPEYYYCANCLECPPRQLFKVKWTNITNGKVYETDPMDENCNIYYIDSLCAGKYTVEVFPICVHEGIDPSLSIFVDDFEIKEATTDLYIVVGVRLFSSSCFLSAFGLHLYKSDNTSILNPDFHPVDPPEGVSYEGDHTLQSLNGTPFHHGYTIDLNSDQHKYAWDVEQGTTNFDHLEMQTSGTSSGVVSFLDWTREYEGRYKQHFTVAKGSQGVPHALTFKMYNNTGDKLLKTKRKPLFHEELICPEDPNAIYGPTGYTNADSTIVQMINATDDIAYTIMFENDPEATAAASRVKITCPLDEHADPTTFRLGNFGFGEHTFEVPPLVSYYNNRIIMDSLGYWLDVTASIQVPENEAYWIFQTIDPETGVAPIDSLGFLPVNDTLIGNGEGFVTFTVSPKAGNNRTQIFTGDTIVEHAYVIFDENETVPTNRYRNMFDAVPPTSIIVCDTMGAGESRVLNIAFNSYDDEGGSGVYYIELYASIDRGGFELVGPIHPDSLFAYPLVGGCHFEFMGLAVDHVGNKEPNKAYSELTYSFGNPPIDLNLDNGQFAENDVIGTLIGNFTTIDDQSTDNFVYTLVDGEGSGDNALFRIDGNQLKTNYDFRCYGTYNYNIRVRTTDITSEYLEKSFVLSATRTETSKPNNIYENLCPGQSIYFGGQYLTTEGIFWDTLTSQLGCDSVVCLRITLREAPVTTLVNDEVCLGYDYTENGFNLTADSLAILTQGWSLEGDSILYLDNYVLNSSGCYDTTRLTLNVHPSFESVTDTLVCQSDLPYVFLGMPFFEDTIVYYRDIHTAMGCDSTLILNLTINPYSTQSDNLATGWNWYSTYIDQSNGQGLLELENALGTHGIIIKSQHDFTQYYPEVQSWYGNLSGIDNKSMYMIQTDAELVTDMLGCPAPDDTITLHSGWTWIGYPVPNTMYVSQTPTAVSGYPSDGDIFKSSSMFSMYYADYGVWYGSLSLLEPGKGYMYKSNSDSDKYLYYPNHSRTEGYLVEVPETHWTDDVHSYANNITILGLVELDGQIIESDTLEVGVFCNGEERGSGRALYLEGLDAYRIFLTVHGEEGDLLSFRLFDHNRDKERRIRCRQQLTFHANDHYGDLKQPYVIRFATDYDKLIEAEICDGQYYTENGFRVFKPGTYFKELVGQHGNDSIIRLDLTVNPVYQYEEEVVAVEFPFQYGDKTFDRAGTFTLPFQTEHGCDSVVVMKVVPYEGVRELMVSPVPASRSDLVTLYFPFTRAEQQGLQVEVYTLTGSLLQYDTPTRFPIELKHFDVAGTYMVKVTMGTGEVVTGKIIVK